MQRTIRIKLQPTPEQADALLETRRQFTDVFNAVAAHGWHHRDKNGFSLHRALYYPLKAHYPALVSDLHISGTCQSHRSPCRCSASCQRPATDRVTTAFLGMCTTL